MDTLSNVAEEATATQTRPAITKDESSSSSEDASTLSEEPEIYNKKKTSRTKELLQVEILKRLRSETEKKDMIMKSRTGSSDKDPGKQSFRPRGNRARFQPFPIMLDDIQEILSQEGSSYNEE